MAERASSTPLPCRYLVERVYSRTFQSKSIRFPRRSGSCPLRLFSQLLLCRVRVKGILLVVYGFL